MAGRTETEGRIHVGTSGYVYPDWRGVFYPPGLPHREELAYYASRFGTVELNNTFYRLPSLTTARGWAARVPAEFVFSVKGSRYLTHIKRLKATGQGIARFFEAIAPLGGRLGPVLWQLPPQMKKDPARLEGFLQALPGGHDYVVELRNPEWYCEEVFELLDRCSASLCLHDLTDAPAPSPPPGPIYYRRFHGLHASYGGRYGRGRLRRPAAEIATLAATGRSCFAYFNNDRNAAATLDAATLATLVTEALARQGIASRP